MKTDKIIRSRHNLAVKIFWYFLIFSTLTLMIFWLFQIVLLNRFYSTTKITDATTLLDEVEVIVKEINGIETLNSNENSKGVLLTLSKSYESDIAIYYLSNNASPSQLIFSTLPENRNIISWVEQVINTLKTNPNPTIDFENRSGSLHTSVTYTRARHMVTKNNQRCLAVIETRLFPVETIKNVLSRQFQIIAIITVVLSIMFASLITYQISQPIIAINVAAKVLAKGKYDTVFKGYGYKEIAELSNTLNYAAKELGKLDRYQKELIANISHDLRTPLTLIAGYSEMMRDFPNEATPQNFQIVIDETNRLTALVNDILNLTKLQSQTDFVRLETYNLTENIEEIIERQKILAKALDFNFEFVYDQEVTICADHEQIAQVIYNFISNAMSYSGDARQILISQIVLDKKVRLEVTDYGVGIAADKLDDVWQRYYKIDQTHNRSQNGSGLGLTIVKSVLENHNFSYGVISEVNVGSTFWFEAPIEMAERKNKNDKS